MRHPVSHVIFCFLMENTFYALQTNMLEEQWPEPWNNVNEGSKMVPRGGIEPPTRGFSVRCSTN